MKATPTLADHVLRMTYADRGRIFTPAFRDALIRARRFVLDESMSTYLADLGWQAFIKPKTSYYPEAVDLNSHDALKAFLQRVDDEDRANAAETMEAARKLARVPFPAMWIEWDEVALAKRAREAYGSEMDPQRVPLRTGWLILRHPTIETAARAYSFGEGSNIERVEGNMAQFGPQDDGNRELGLAPFAFAWTSADDENVPWATLPAAIEFSRKRGLSTGAMASGLTSYESDKITFVAGGDMLNPRLAQQADALMRVQLQEQFGMARYVLSLLATINDLPIQHSEVRASKGFVARGNYRKFLDHSVVTLSIPAKRYKALARKSLISLRRRAHEVRGHWRDHWRFPGSASCDHKYDAIEGRLQCSLCGKRRMWITEYMRNDDKVGFVVHTYNVTHPTENGAKTP